MPKRLLASERFPPVSSNVLSIKVFSNSSTISSRKNPLPTRWSTSAANVSFISCLPRIRQIPNALFQGAAPNRFHLLVALAKSVFQLARGDGGAHPGGIDHVRSHARLDHRIRRRLAGCERQQSQHDGNGDQKPAHQSEAGAQQ